MKKLILNETETKELEQDGVVEITRNGFDILVEKNRNTWEDEPYIITIINPFEQVVLTKTKKPIKLVAGNWYKFNDRGNEYIGQYIGNDDEFECCVCGKGHKAHIFNVYYSENDYESWGYGASHLPKLIENLGKSENIIIGE